MSLYFVLIEPLLCRGIIAALCLSTQAHRASPRADVRMPAGLNVVFGTEPRTVMSQLLGRDRN